MSVWDATTTMTPTVTRTPTLAGRHRTPRIGSTAKAATVRAVPSSAMAGVPELKALP
jgi:hypothetical protein